MLDAVIGLDADAISIEAWRSRMRLLEVFSDFAYPGQIGRGIYDLRSPRVPSVEETELLLELADARVLRAQLWAVPDCRPKTRGWFESLAAIGDMVRAASNRDTAVMGVR